LCLQRIFLRLPDESSGSERARLPYQGEAPVPHPVAGSSALDTNPPSAGLGRDANFSIGRATGKRPDSSWGYENAKNSMRIPPKHNSSSLSSTTTSATSPSSRRAPGQAHRAYGARATSETWIEEAKGQMGLAHVKTDHFLANAALFQCAVLVYNTARWMALISGNATLKRWESQTARTFLIRVAGKLLTGANQLRIKLPREHLHPEVWSDWLALSQPAWEGWGQHRLTPHNLSPPG